MGCLKNFDCNLVNCHDASVSLAVCIVQVPNHSLIESIRQQQGHDILHTSQYFLFQNNLIESTFKRRSTDGHRLTTLYRTHYSSGHQKNAHPIYCTQNPNFQLEKKTPKTFQLLIYSGCAKSWSPPQWKRGATAMQGSNESTPPAAEGGGPLRAPPIFPLVGK